MSDKSMFYTTAFSFAAHALFALLLALAPARTPVVELLTPNEVRLVAVADLTIPPEMEAEVTEIIEAVPEPAAMPEERSTRPRTTDERPAPITTAPVAGATSGMVGSITGPSGPVGPTSTDVAPVGESEADRERRLRGMGSLIDPRRAAAGFVLRDDPGPVRPSGPAGLGDPGGETVRPMSVAEAEALHSGHLGAAAATKSYLSDTHPPLTPHPDGTYTYRGHAFTATIRPNGEVVYSDRGAVEYDVGSGAGSFDLGDMIMGAAGADPYAAERSWFEEEHQELIDRLVDEARVADRERALRRLRGRLSLIWQDRTHSAEHRRRELFDLWDDSSEDEADHAARDAVIAFIRSELPSSSEDAYPASEVSTLNAGRHSTEPFDPY
jgi:hypothetical protein